MQKPEATRVSLRLKSGCWRMSLLTFAVSLADTTRHQHVPLYATFVFILHASSLWQATLYAVGMALVFYWHNARDNCMSLLFRYVTGMCRHAPLTDTAVHG